MVWSLVGDEAGLRVRERRQGRGGEGGFLPEDGANTKSPR